MPFGLSGAPRTSNKGHACGNRVQTSPGSNSTEENSDRGARGRKSEPQRPNLLTSEHCQKANYVVRQQSKSSNGSLLPRCPIQWPSSSTVSAKHRTGTVVLFTRSFVIRSTSPPVQSEGSISWTSRKVSPYARKSTVTSVDGVNDSSGSGGEPLDALAKLSKSIQDDHTRLPGVKVQFTSPEVLRRKMSSIAIRSHQSENDSQFLDPFAGSLAGLERQPSDISDISDYIRPHAFAGHRDTLARINPSNVGSRIVNESYAFDDYDEGIGMSVDIDHSTSAKAASGTLFASSCFPAEILHHIFALLQPCDFDAARHTCRNWYIASLDKRLTHVMMRKAGCYPAFLADLSHQRQIARHLRMRYNCANGNDIEVNNDLGADDINEPWLASKRLATESRLSPAWHGSGLSTNSGHTRSRLSITETVSFSNIMCSQPKQECMETETFTVSSCGKFLLVIAECDIYVYDLQKGNSSLQPIVRLAAGAKVLKVSMDTASQRFAVAALLEGRCGACWEIGDFVLNNAVNVLSRSPDQQSKGGIAGSSIPNIRGEDWSSSSTPWSMMSAEQAIPDAQVVPGQGEKHPESSIAVCIRPNATYQDLGTVSDPPRSVAICPQRKCAAFGCRSGIELHWVDAVTGHDLHRWFPLAAPSDHLHFLSQRSGIDSNKKLRLMSSAAAPWLREESQRTKSSTGVPAVIESGRARRMTRLFHGNFSLLQDAEDHSTELVQPEFDVDQTPIRAINCDHYRAVPLSDGSHVLFTDPVTGMLCLGNDAPLGGPTRLVRKACMMPPGNNASSQGPFPTCYAAAHDIKWGIRIVAAYNDGKIVLYNIPSECYDRLRHVRSSPDIWDEIPGTVGQSDLMMDFFMSNRDAAISQASDENTASFKSLQIDGALLCQVDVAVQSLAVDGSNGGLKLWTFQNNGQATQMDVYVPEHHQIKSRYVGLDGLLHNRAPPHSLSAITKRDTYFCDEGIVEDDNHNSSHSPDVQFLGLDGCCENTRAVCGPIANKDEIDYSKLPYDEGISMTPAFSDDEDNDDDDRPLQVELLTDWRAESLLRPYIVNVSWIDAR